MNIPATVTTWGEVRPGNKVLVMRRSSNTVASWSTRIDTIVDIEPSSAANALTITARTDPAKLHKEIREVKYLVDRDMLAAVIHSDPEGI